AEGTRFRNSFLTTSICCVSRASILSGQYARRHHVNDFKTQLASLANTYPVLLRQNGYYTGFIGKWGVDANNKEYLSRCAAEFDFWAGATGQSAYWHAADCNYITSNNTTDRTNCFCSCPPAAQKGDGVTKTGPNPTLKNPVHAETEFMPAKIRSFLDARDGGKPFCLSVSFKAPHGPIGGFAPRFAKDFENENIPRRPNVNEQEALRQPAFLRASLHGDDGLELARDTELNGPRNQKFRQYYRLIEGVDFAVGEILNELAKRGLATNTIIIFTSDNGYFSGEHGFLGKWFMHEESLRAPMLVADPRAPAAQKGQTCDEMVLNVDVGPTILDFAGVKIPAVMQGQSMLPLLAAPTRHFRDEFFYEHLFEFAPKPPNHIERSEGLRTADWKYTLYVDQTGPARKELYHISADPFETNNLAADPQQKSRLEAMSKRHLEMRKELK
ncbi:MAG: sulfatase-like hydrolase/transferase, partial [Verrucomicrobia bacterium]|nr:sulfatase-like hydrolase/transferase [Verrucomicrobiota bacterium]